MKVQGILFDCDGVLLDSEAIYLEALVQYLGTLGISAVKEDVVSVLGKTMPMIVAELRSKFDLKQYSDEEIITGQRKIFRAMFNEIKLEPMPNLVAFLKICKSKGLKLAIASSSDHSYLHDVLERLGISEYFDEIVSGQRVERSKPAPDIYLKAAECVGLPVDSLIVIEDSVNGIRAGKNAGIYTVGYKGSVVEQDTHEADVEVRDFMEIML